MNFVTKAQGAPVFSIRQLLVLIAVLAIGFMAIGILVDSIESEYARTRCSTNHDRETCIHWFSFGGLGTAGTAVIYRRPISSVKPDVKRSGRVISVGQKKFIMHRREARVILFDLVGEEIFDFVVPPDDARLVTDVVLDPSISADEIMKRLREILREKSNGSGLFDE